MELAMRGSGAKTKLTGMESLHMQMAMSTKATGLPTRLTDRGHTSTQTVHATVENGLRTNSTDEGLNNGLMALSTKACTEMARRTVKVL